MFKCYYCNCKYKNILAYKNDMRFECFGYNKQIVKCCECSLVQLYPRWTKEELGLLYSSYSEKQDFAGQKKKEKQFMIYELGKLFDKDKKILEIGCGNGNIVDFYRKLGYDIIGIDKDETVKNEYIFNVDFNDFYFEKKYDLIYALHVLEHISDPEEFILKIYNNLNVGGKFFLEIPNAEDPLLTLYKNKGYKKFWYPYHLFFWTPNTIKKMFSKLNIKVKIKRTQRYGVINHLRWLIKNKPGNFNNLIPFVDDFYHWFLINFFKISDTIQIIGVKE